MDRTIAPKVNQIADIHIPSVERSQLDCGIEVFYVQEASAEAFKIEALHQGGFLHLPSASTSSLLNKLLTEGTMRFPGKTFLDTVDGLGSFVESAPSFDHGMLSLFGLSRFFKENIALFASVLYESEFKAERLTQLKKKETNRIKLNQEKGSYLTSTALRKRLFGSHPYGYTAKIQDVLDLDIGDLKTLYRTKIQSFSLFLSGHLPQDFLSILNEQFNRAYADEASPFSVRDTITPAHYEKRDDKYVQSSIRLGKELFNRTHKDYSAFMLLNEILGGYFGSRLMKNIREDKGYTYGISSHLYALKETGYFTIGTEVNQEAEADTLKQIQLEFDLLRNELVSEEELSTVKNYILGSFANSLSAPFATIDKFKTLYTQGLDLSFYDAYLADFRALTSHDILHTAQKYLDFDGLTKAIVGRPYPF